MSEELKKHEKRPVNWHDGFKVSSSDIPIHGEEMYIEVPRRLKRKHKRKLLEIQRRTQLPKNHDEYLNVQEADWELVEFLLEVGVRWNWVDDNGNAFAQPEDAPEIYDEISDDEIVFILDHIEDGTAIPPPKGTG